ncbi:putative catenin alpha-2-like [Triplophysa rosa]|uniref:Catenin alpha-2 n=1 Tax=Triplophysa rosa TaxID=992332 RepID=A0A9W7X005_TRIRA|nr:putative catenin alpha-2-like [Triplophysa rosa]
MIFIVHILIHRGLSQEFFQPSGLEINVLWLKNDPVTTLVNTSNKGPSGKKKGRSKKAHVLAVSVEQATQNFLEKGEQIAKDSQDLKEELIAAVEDVRKQGETMRVASSEFADDPCSSVKRGTMVRAARALLSAVTRLLILADMADVMRLLAHLKIVEEALEGVKNATNEQDLANRFKEFGKEMVKLNYVAARRQQELKDPQCRDEMAAARGALKKNATMLYTASQAFLRHPDVTATRANRDYVFKQVQEAIGGISSAAQATSPTDEKHGHAGIGELAAALNEFDGSSNAEPNTNKICDKHLKAPSSCCHDSQHIHFIFCHRCMNFQDDTTAMSSFSTTQ